MTVPLHGSKLILIKEVIYLIDKCRKNHFAISIKLIFLLLYQTSEF